MSKHHNCVHFSTYKINGAQQANYLVTVSKETKFTQGLTQCLGTERYEEDIPINSMLCIEEIILFDCNPSWMSFSVL